MTKISEGHLIILAGPTAVGKTSCAIALARALSCDIVNADSRQVYREMDIGVARPSPEDLQQVTHHLIAHRSVTSPYSVRDYIDEAIPLITRCIEKDGCVLLTGGSGQYIDAVRQGMDDIPAVSTYAERQVDLWSLEGIEKLQQELQDRDPAYYDRVDLNNSRRLVRALKVCLSTGTPFSRYLTGKSEERRRNTIAMALSRPRDELYERINMRVLNMIDQGWIDEVISLSAYRDHRALDTVGYRELMDYIDGDIDLGIAIERIQQSTRRYAKRQMTWLRHHGTWEYFRVQEMERMMNYITASRLSDPQV